MQPAIRAFQSMTEGRSPIGLQPEGAPRTEECIAEHNDKYEREECLAAKCQTTRGDRTAEGCPRWAEERERSSRTNIQCDETAQKRTRKIFVHRGQSYHNEIKMTNDFCEWRVQSVN